MNQIKNKLNLIAALSLMLCGCLNATGTARETGGREKLAEFLTTARGMHCYISFKHDPNFTQELPVEQVMPCCANKTEHLSYIYNLSVIGPQGQNTVLVANGQIQEDGGRPAPSQPSRASYTSSRAAAGPSGFGAFPSGFGFASGSGAPSSSSAAPDFARTDPDSRPFMSFSLAGIGKVEVSTQIVENSLRVNFSIPIGSSSLLNHLESEIESEMRPFFGVLQNGSISMIEMYLHHTSSNERTWFGVSGPTSLLRSGWEHQLRVTINRFAQNFSARRS